MCVSPIGHKPDRSLVVAVVALGRVPAPSEECRALVIIIIIIIVIHIYIYIYIYIYIHLSISSIQKWLEMGLASLNPFPATSVSNPF